MSIDGKEASKIDCDTETILLGSPNAPNFLNLDIDQKSQKT